MNPAWREDVRKIFKESASFPIREYSTTDFGREKNPHCLSIVVPEDDARELLKTLRAKLGEGFIAFIGTSRWLGAEDLEGSVEVVIGRGNTQFDILREAKSDACNYDMETEDLIKKLTEYDQNYGISIFHAETDTIEFELIDLPEDLLAFAEDIYQFCPDIIDQGDDSVEDLAETIEAMREVFLWWD
jgi:hypothetical protein